MSHPELLADAPPSAPGPNAPATHFFARQPILDRKRQVFGHEFLFRSGTENHFVGYTPAAAHQATLQMVDNSILYDFEWLAGGMAFLNCTRDFLTSNVIGLLPRKSTVLELPDDIDPTPQIVETCRDIRVAGYQLALSNFRPRAGMERLLPLADYIKIDFRISDAAARRETLRYISLKRSPARLIAEKVETQEEFDVAARDHFHFFQGFFFCEPVMLSRDQIPTNVLNHLALLAAVNKTAFDWWEIERLVRSDPALLYRLLRLVNSVGFATATQISSVHAALMILGEVKFRKLALLAVTTELSRNKPSELLFLALQRATFCELAAYSLHQDPSEQYLFGLISLFPALLGASVEQVVDMLPVSAPLKEAMLGKPNGISDALHTMLRYELDPTEDRDMWDSARTALKDEDVERWYHESMERAHQAAHAYTS